MRLRITNHPGGARFVSHFVLRGVHTLLLSALLVYSGCDAPDSANLSRSPGPAGVSGVLVLLSSASHLELRDQARYPTGFFLNELTVPVSALIAAGYEPVLATPDGKPARMDPASDQARFFRDEREYARMRALLERLLPQTRALDDVLAEGLSAYAGVFVPGGHAPMQDLARDPRVGRILREFHDSGRTTALICHGPAALLSASADPRGVIAALEAGDARKAREAAGDWPYAGYRMTAFSEAEEDAVESSGRLAARLRWDVEPALRALGAKVEVNRANFKSRIVRDRELITGQNPASDGAFTEALLESLRTRAAR